MCALMPMLRYLSMGVVRGIAFTVGWAGCVWRRVATSNACRPTRVRSSESEVREGLVGLGHAVHFLALLDRAAAAFRGVDQLAREARAHRLLAALARGLAQPAHRERDT